MNSRLVRQKWAVVERSIIGLNCTVMKPSQKNKGKKAGRGRPAGRSQNGNGFLYPTERTETEQPLGKRRSRAGSDATHGRLKLPRLSARASRPGRPLNSVQTLGEQVGQILELRQKPILRPPDEKGAVHRGGRGELKTVKYTSAMSLTRREKFLGTLLAMGRRAVPTFTQGLTCRRGIHRGK